MREDIEKYLDKKYGSKPEYLWRRYPGYAVFRHEDNRKWYAIIMNVTADKLGRDGEEEIAIIDVKIDDLMLRDILIRQEGYYPGYHMNKNSWITIALDGTVPFEEVCNMIDASFDMTLSARQKSYHQSSNENKAFKTL